MRPSISVVVPAYNGQHLIVQALESVALQTCSPRSLLVVDDCSTDATVEVCESWKRDRQVSFDVQVLRLSENSGNPVAPINRGITASDDEFIAVLEQDDAFHPSKLELTMAVFREFPDLAFLSHSGTSDADENAASISQRNFHRDREVKRTMTDTGLEFAKLSCNDAALMGLRHSMYPAGFPGIVFRRSAWLQAGKCEDHYKIVNDFSFLLRLTRCGASAHVFRPLYSRRSHATNLSHSSGLAYVESLVCIRKFLVKHPEVMSVPGVREAIGWRVTEAAWNMAAFGFLSQSKAMIKDVIATNGWTWSRQSHQTLRWLMPAYRKLRMRRAVSNQSIADNAVEQSKRLLQMFEMGPPSIANAEQGSADTDHSLRDRP